MRLIFPVEFQLKIYVAWLYFHLFVGDYTEMDQIEQFHEHYFEFHNIVLSSQSGLLNESVRASWWGPVRINPQLVRILLVAGCHHSCEKGSTSPGVRAVIHDCLIKGLGMSSVSMCLGI